jgi:hypothetical protein
VHGGLLRNVKIFSQSNGLVANLQANMARIVKSSSVPLVMNAGDSKVAIVHQYDRNAGLQADLFKKVRYFSLLNKIILTACFPLVCVLVGFI